MQWSEAAASRIIAPMKTPPCASKSRLQHLLWPALGLAVAGLIVCGVLLVAFSEPGCTLRGGRWAMAQMKCYTPRCFEAGDCGHWAAPIAQCPHVSLGDHRAKVHFELGNPLPGPPQELRWPADKVSGDTIVARFDGDRLVSLACPAIP